jgi:hypothetical protein
MEVETFESLDLEPKNKSNGATNVRLGRSDALLVRLGVIFKWPSTAP